MVGSAAVARAATRLLRIRPSRLRVIPLAGGRAFAPFSMEDTEVGDAERAALAADRERFGIPERYLVHTGRHDARHDLGTLLDALARLAAAGRPPRLAKSVRGRRGSPRQHHPDDRAAVAVALRPGVGDLPTTRPASAAQVDRLVPGPGRRSTGRLRRAIVPALVALAAACR